MPISFFQKLFSAAGKSTAPRAFLSATHWPARIYAIGDVHGCHAQLQSLEEKIIQDSEGVAGEKWIVMLGDYVDRGPASAGVLNHLCEAPPVGFQRICLAGNHEIMMLQFLSAPDMTSDWLRFGGTETLLSYDVHPSDLTGLSLSGRLELLRRQIPRTHVDFMTSLPLALALPGLTFVHAGIRPGIDMGEQVEDDLIWIREPFLGNSASLPFRVVHGHTPVDQPEVIGQRIGIDTRAYASGILTSLHINEDFELRFLDTRKA